MLIRRRVFEELEEPWFQHPSHAPGIGEDTFFCKRPREVGFSIWVRTGVAPGHMAEMAVDLPMVRAMDKGGGLDWGVARGHLLEAVVQGRI